MKTKLNSSARSIKLYIPHDQWMAILAFINQPDSPYNKPSQFIRAAIDLKLANQDAKDKTNPKPD